MSHQQFESESGFASSQQQHRERPYNDDPREHYAQPPIQEGMTAERNYEEGYQGYYASHLHGEKLQPPSQSLQSWKIVLIILIIALVVSGTGAIGSLVNVIFGFLGGSFGLIVAIFIVVAAISTRPVPLPTRTFTVAERAMITLHNDAGSIRVLPGKNNEVEVRGIRYVSRLLGESKAVPLFTSQDGDAITINVRYWNFLSFFHIGYVNLEIYLPAASDIQLHSNAGTLDITGVNGHVHASTHAGTILVTSSNLEQGSSLNTSAGTLTFRQTTFNGDAQSHTDAGTIDILESVVSGRASFTTSAGTIRFDGELTPGSETRLETNAGTIDAFLPSTTSFALTARTNMGTVQNDFGSNLVGDGPHARLNLKSQMGTVTVRRKN